MAKNFLQTKISGYKVFIVVGAYPIHMDMYSACLELSVASDKFFEAKILCIIAMILYNFDFLVVFW